MALSDDGDLPTAAAMDRNSREWALARGWFAVRDEASGAGAVA